MLRRSGSWRATPADPLAEHGIWGRPHQGAERHRRGKRRYPDGSNAGDVVPAAELPGRDRRPVAGRGRLSAAGGLQARPVLAFVGVVTFLRLVQSPIEDLAYADRIALLRSFYLRVSPELDPHLVAVPGTRSAASYDAEKLAPSARQLTVTAAGMVAVVTSVVVVACTGLVWNLRASTRLRFRLPSEQSSDLLRSRCTKVTTVARDAYSPEAVDRAAIFVSPSQRADAA
jgi:hypothetical protein